MSAAEKFEVLHNPAVWVRGSKLPVIWGITPEAGRKYRERGLWLEGKHWCRDPAGRIAYNVAAINDWFGGSH